MAGEFPTTLLEFEDRFNTDEACRQFLARLRWPQGFRCPRCRAARAWPRAEGGLWECAGCGYKASATAGTIFDRTQLPLRLWFRAMWLITSQKSGVSALALQRQLGLKRYETVWTMLHKLRRAMVRHDRARLSGVVEVDETFLGGVEAGVSGREPGAKMLVAIAAEEDDKRIGRIRVEPVPDGSAASLIPFVERNVTPGSTAHTDGWEGYRDLSAKGYQHKITRIKGSGKLGHEVLPRVHRVAALLKRWWLGTHQGAIGPLHLDYYLDEFVFRFNRRTSRSRGQLFYRLVQQAVEASPVHWRNVADAEPGTDRNG